MSDNEIRIAVAKELGWKEVNRPGAVSGWPNYQWQRGDDVATWGQPPPDFPNDLNACAEMVATLNRAQMKAFARDLAFITSPQPFVDFWDCRNEFDLFRAENATARQRCEAFLRTIGKWRDSEAVNAFKNVRI